MDKIQNITPELQEMLIDYQNHGGEKNTSDCWITLNQIHIRKLTDSGYDNFKHTIAGHYFTFLLEPVTPQLDFLINNLSKEEIYSLKKVAKTLPLPLYTTKEFDLVTLLFWQYAKNQGLEKELAKLSEPLEGSPPAVNFEGRLISQDLANSLLEWDVIHKHTPPKSIKSVLEIGAGYGRSAYVWLQLGELDKYVIVDIPPALYISQTYLSSQFPSKKVFKYRDFKSFAKVEAEYNQADLVFLMPWQIEMLPKKSFDLIYAVDSLSEMNPDLLVFYFKLIDRLCKDYFYIRYCKINEIGTIKQGSYPIPPGWKSILVDSQCLVQTEHLESLYKLP